MKTQRKTEKLGQEGFTLVEMLVVLVIIGILVTITFIALEGTGKKSRLAAATSSVKSAMTVATTCLSMGGDVQDPVPVPIGPGPVDPVPVCDGVAQIAESVWPELPDDCEYCKKDKTGTKIYFQCSCDSCLSTDCEKSYCDYKSGQCVQND